MRIDIDAFWEHYYDSKKRRLVDNWQEGIRILPFSSNPSSAVDRGAGIEGPTGLFFRILGNESVTAIENTQEAQHTIETYLRDHIHMEDGQISTFIKIMNDILFFNGSINVTDTSFLKYLPLVPNDENLTEKTKKKYRSGQTKLAHLLYSISKGDIKYSERDSKNLFTRVIRQALSTGDSGFGEGTKSTEKYYTLPYVSKSFKEDLEWLLSLDPTVVIRQIHLLLHFYVCYELLQSVSKLSYRRQNTNEQEYFYFILHSEKASVSHDAVRNWKDKFPKGILDKIFGHSQSLDILNSVLGGSVGFYKEVMDTLSQTPFEVNKEACEELLNIYQTEKRKVFDTRSSESGSIEEIDTSVSSYEEFLHKMEILCTGLQSPSYNSRMRKKFIDVLSIRFLQLRRGNYVLSLDNEMLLFLIAMVTKSKRIKVEEMYKRFKDYGIVFNLGTRNAIEAYLLKLNLLDRKSDSGEAQYVKIVL